jgi:drug/metabolite transporter (DMT)-like permease
LTIPIGELAALGTSLCLSATSVLFTLAGREVGSLTVNRARLLLSVFFLSLTHQAFLNAPVPLDAEAERWLYFSLSGIVGLVVADAFLFKAFVLIGPRLTMLMMSLVPVAATLMAWVIYAETLKGSQVTGIVMTLCGIVWVIVDRGDHENREAMGGDFRRGIACCLCAAFFTAAGMILAKKGLQGDFSAISGNMMRTLAAAVALLVYTIIQGELGQSFSRLYIHRRALLHIGIGTIIGPIVGLSLFLFSLQKAPLGVASTLMRLAPIFLLPVGYFYFNEKFGWGSVIGTVISVIGVGMLFFL